MKRDDLFFNHGDDFAVDALVLIVESTNASVHITRGRVIGRRTTSTVVDQRVVSQDVALVRIAGDDGFSTREVPVELLCEDGSWWSVSHKAEQLLGQLTVPASVLERNPNPDLEEQPEDHRADDDRPF